MRRPFSYLFIPLLIIAAFFKMGCVNLPTKPIIPQWDVSLNIPIVNRSYALSDIIKKQNYISIQDSGTPSDIFLIQSNSYSISKDVSTFVQALGSQSTNDNVVSGAGTKELFVQFPNNVKIYSAVFSSGNLSYSFSNPSVQTVTVTLAIPGISINGTPFSTTIPLSPGASVTNSVDFSGATYTLPADQVNNPFFDAKYLEVQVGATSGTPAVIGINLTTANFYFNSATGYLPAKSLGVKSSSFSLNINNAKDYRDKVTLKNADLKLDAVYVPAASNNNPFPIEVNNLTITGVRSDGKTLQLTIPDSAKTFTFSGTDKHFDFDASNSNITSFISFLPDSISVSAEYIMNPNNANGTVAAGDSVKFSANFSTTSFLAISSSSTTDTSSIGTISDNDRTKIKASQSAYISVGLQNSIPLDATVRVNIVDSLYRPLFTLVNNTTGADSFAVAPASVDQNGEVSAPGTTNFTVQLDSSQTDLLSQAHYAIYTVSVQTPGSTPVAVRPSDVILIQVYGGVKFRINNDNLK